MDKVLRSIIGAALIATLVGCAPSGYSAKNRDYKQLDRGSFRGSFYTVDKGDTLYYIAYITDRNVNNLIRFNNLKAPYTLRVGQRIKLWHPDYKDTTPAYTSSKPVAVAQTSTAKSPPPAQTTAQNSAQTSTNPQKTFQFSLIIFTSKKVVKPLKCLHTHVGPIAEATEKNL